jgi:predicted TPR repeat methyltransferase
MPVRVFTLISLGRVGLAIRRLPTRRPRVQRASARMSGASAAASAASSSCCEPETDAERTLRIYWRNQVEGLFDEYAATFEDSLVQKLGYTVPAQMEATLARDHAAEDGSVSRHLAVDLGCGTGLVGAALRSRCHGRLLGCDLSGLMVEEARKKLGVFDGLEACDCVAFLRRRVERGSADLLLAADVLIYPLALAASRWP